MSATVTLRPRPLLLAGAVGVLAAAVIQSALVTPWLALLVREPDEVNWLNASDAFQRFFRGFVISLKIAAFFSPFFLGVAAFAERRKPCSLRLGLLLGIVCASPLAFLGWRLVNIGFDCFTNCEPSWLRDLVMVGSILAAGAAGALVAWLVRHAGRRETT